MLKTKNALLLLLILALTSLSIAQITISQGSLAGIGSSYSSYSPDVPVGTVDVGPTGANQNWTVPETEVLLDAVIDIVNPANTPYSNDFPTATHAFTANIDTFSSGFSYVRIQSDAFYNLGSGASAMGQDILIIYDPPGLVAPLPATWGTNDWTSRTSWTSEPIPGFTMTQIDCTLTSIDGWGTMNTQFGSFNVLRLQNHDFSTTISEFPPLPPTITETSTWSYEWITADGTPVATMRSVVDESDPNFTQGYLTLSTSGAQSADPVRGPVAESFTVGQNYPNPFNPTTSLPIKLEQAGKVEITIYNEMGQVVSHEEHSFGPGTHQVPFDGSAWASGTFFANVRSGKKQQTKRMQLVK